MLYQQFGVNNLRSTILILQVTQIDLRTVYVAFNIWILFSVYVAVAGYFNFILILNL